MLANVGLDESVPLIDTGGHDRVDFRAIHGPSELLAFGERPFDYPEMPDQ